MWREDLVLLRSHQDLADVTNNLVAGRLSLQWFFYSTNSLGEIFLFSYIVMLPSVPMMSRTFLEHFISLNFIFQYILWPTKKSLLKPHLSPLLPRHPSLCSAAASPRAHRGRWAGWRRRRTSRAPKASSLPSASRTSRWSACCFPGDACQWKCYRYQRRWIYQVEYVQLFTWRGQSWNLFCRSLSRSRSCWHLEEPANLGRLLNTKMNNSMPVKLMVEVLKMSWKSLQKKTLSLSSISLARFIPWHTSDWSWSLLCLNKEGSFLSFLPKYISFYTCHQAERLCRR